MAPGERGFCTITWERSEYDKPFLARCLSRDVKLSRSAYAYFNQFLLNSKDKPSAPRLQNSREFTFLRPDPRIEHLSIVWGANTPVNRTTLGFALGSYLSISLSWARPLFLSDKWPGSASSLLTLPMCNFLGCSNPTKWRNGLKRDKDFAGLPKLKAYPYKDIL